MRGTQALRVTALAAALTAVGVVAAEAAQGYTTGNVNFRVAPDSNSYSYGVIPRGTIIEVYSCQSWCQVAWRGQTGWVFASYVRYGAYQPPAYQPPTYQPPVYRPPVYTPPPAYVRPPPPTYYPPYPGWWPGYPNQNPSTYVPGPPGVSR